MADPMEPTVEVRYTCHGCHAKNRRVMVRARANEEDVVAWINTVVSAAVSLDHIEFSCHSTEFDLKIHVPKDADYIGQARKQ